MTSHGVGRAPRGFVASVLLLLREVALLEQRTALIEPVGQNFTPARRIGSGLDRT
jgi:hypothetical protein